MGVENLGWVKSIFEGLNPPSNTKMLWFNTNVGENRHYYYNQSISYWTPLNTIIQEDSLNNFPNVGDVSTLYIDRSTKKSYICLS